MNVLIADRTRRKLKSWQKNWNRFAKEALRVNLDEDEQAILYSAQINRKTAVKSGHARGKDYTAAVASVCQLYLIFNSMVLQTAPTGRQVINIMLAETKNIWNNAVIPLGGDLMAEGIRFTKYPKWCLLGFKAGDKKAEDWTGFHSQNLMMVVTEASGIEQATFNAIEGVLTGDSRLLLIFNPHHTTGECYNAFKNNSYHTFTLNCLNAPNVLAKKTLIPGQVDWEWVNDKVGRAGWSRKITPEEFNKDNGDFEWEGSLYTPSDLFRVKVLGMWPKESENQLIPLAWVEAAIERYKQWRLDGSIIPETSLRLGVDIAGQGVDNSVLCYRWGDLVEKFTVCPTSDHMGAAGFVRSILRSKKGSVAFVDTIGEGAGVHSRLEELEENSISVKFSESATNLKDATEEREFLNMRAYLWWSLRDSLDPSLNGSLMLPDDCPELTEDLTSVHWKITSNGKIQIEPKDKIKESLGRSPDWGDSLVNTFYAPNYGEAWIAGGIDVSPE